MALVINGRFLTRPITGVERYGHALLKVIAREWPKSKVIVPRSFSGECQAHGLEVVRAGRMHGHAWEQLELPRMLGTNDVLLSPANSGPLRAKRHVVAIHDLAFWHHPEWFSTRFSYWYRMLMPRLANRAERIITVSHASADDLQRSLFVLKDKITVVPPFVDGVPFATNDDTAIGSPYFLVVGSRDPRKGIDRVLEWYRNVEDPSFKLVVVGRGRPSFAASDMSTIEGVITHEDVGDARLAALYRNAIALIQPSLLEGFGLPILEAMSLGCPVIANDIPVFRENFNDGACFIDGASPKAMTEATQRLIKDVTFRNAAIARGRTCAARFTEQATAAALHSILDPLLRN